MPHRALGAGGISLGELLTNFGDMAKTAFASGLAERKPRVDRGAGQQGELLGADCDLRWPGGDCGDHDFHHGEGV